MIPPQCPGCDRAVSQHHGFACNRCALRLPPRLRDSIRNAPSDRYPATHRLAVESAVEWLQAHPWREPPAPRRLTEEEQREARAFLERAYAVLEGTGEHAEHEREQVGRCVYCSCGTRVQGRMAS